MIGLTTEDNLSTLLRFREEDVALDMDEVVVEDEEQQEEPSDDDDDSEESGELAEDWVESQLLLSQWAILKKFH